METQRRIDIARGIARSVLLSAYRIRSKLAYVTFSGTKSELQENFTRNFDLIEKKIMATKAYGKTPLAAALKMIYDLSNGMEERTVSILITDGRANVPIKGNLQEELMDIHRRHAGLFRIFPQDFNHMQMTCVIHDQIDRIFWYMIVLDAFMTS